jgi:hypothetical protein
MKVIIYPGPGWRDECPGRENKAKKKKCEKF